MAESRERNGRYGSRITPTSERVARHHTHGFALVLGLVLASPAPACLDRFEQAREEGAQERLRDFKASARAELDRLDVELQRLKSIASEANGPPSSDIEALAGRRNGLAQRVEGLAIDGRSRWDQAKEEIESQLAELTLDVEAAVEAFSSSAVRP